MLIILIIIIQIHLFNYYKEVKKPKVKFFLGTNLQHLFQEVFNVYFFQKN